MTRSLAGAALLAGGFTAGLLLAQQRTPDPAVLDHIATGAPAAAETMPARNARPQSALAALPDLSAVADRAVQAAANISSRQAVRTPNSPFARDPVFQYFFGNQDPFGYSLRQSQSLGSGVIVSPDGYVLTNNHVIGDTRAEITVTLPDNRELPATIVGADAMTDLAVVKVEASDLTPLPWGDSSRLRLAEWVLAVGNPFALNHSVSLGIISAVGRASPDLGAYTDFIQTDAAINPGNSGGSLVNSRGELIGINAAIYSATGGYQGIGFAIPSNLARRIMDELVAHGEVRWGSIDGVGFRGLTPGLARQVGYDSTRGVIVYEIYRDSDAHRAGLQPGDVIVGFQGRPVEDLTQFTRMLADSAIGSRVRLDVVRQERNQRRTLTIEVPIVSTQQVRRRR